MCISSSKCSFLSPWPDTTKSSTAKASSLLPSLPPSGVKVAWEGGGAGGGEVEEEEGEEGAEEIGSCGAGGKEGGREGHDLSGRKVGYEQEKQASRKGGREGRKKGRREGCAGLTFQCSWMWGRGARWLLRRSWR